MLLHNPRIHKPFARISAPGSFVANPTRGKRALPHVAAFEQDLDRELLSLQPRLQREQAYRPGGYRDFMAYDGKPRRITS